MTRRTPGGTGSLLAGLLLSAGMLAAGCAAWRTPAGELAVGDALGRYAALNAEQLRACDPPPLPVRASAAGAQAALAPVEVAGGGDAPAGEFRLAYFAPGMMPQESAASQPGAPASSAGGVPEGYWRKDVWHQAGNEFGQLLRRDFWRGFKSSFWDLENALALTAAMGASIAIRGTGVDDTIRSRVEGHRQLGDMDETIQILGNPATHFAGTGVLWLASALTRDAREHEVAKALTQALAVNGVTTLALKVATNTRAPDGENLAWPSGHTSSAVAAAAVLNEYYGPWVGIPSFALAGLVGYQRIDSRTHDFSDVVFGAVLGYVVGTSIARDQKAQFPELFGMQVVPFADPQTGATGLALMKSW